MVACGVLPFVPRYLPKLPLGLEQWPAFAHILLSLAAFVALISVAKTLERLSMRAYAPLRAYRVASRAIPWPWRLGMVAATIAVFFAPGLNLEARNVVLLVVIAASVLVQMRRAGSTKDHALDLEMQVKALTAL